MQDLVTHSYVFQKLCSDTNLSHPLPIHLLSGERMWQARKVRTYIGGITLHQGYNLQIQLNLQPQCILMHI